MFECFHRSFLFPAQCCQFINNVETVIIHSINCVFHLLYSAICKSLYNESVVTHIFNVIKSQRSIPSFFNYYHNNSPNYHSHKDLLLRTNLYTEISEDRGKINYDIFISVAFSKPPPTSVLTRQILQRQNAVENLSSISKTYNNIF